MRVVLNDFEAVKNAVDILEVIGSEVSLKRVGNSYQGLCPFHKEKTPSFSVSVEAMSFHCFGCGEKGDAITFVEKVNDISNVEAMKVLAEKHNVTISSPKKKLKKSRKQEVWFLVATFYHERLMRFKDRECDGFNPFEYLISVRKRFESTLKTFMIGWSCSSKVFLEGLLAVGVTKEELVAFGVWKLDVEKNVDKAFFAQDVLLYPHFVGEDIYTFTLKDPITKDPEKKIGYQMTKKSRHSDWLFYNQGALNSPVVVICEGENDLHAVYESGVKNVVALIGQPSQAQLNALRNEGKGREYILCFDDQVAGHAYTRKVAEGCVGVEGCSVKVVDLAGEYAQ